MKEKGSPQEASCLRGGTREEETGLTGGDAQWGWGLSLGARCSGLGWARTQPVRKQASGSDGEGPAEVCTWESRVPQWVWSRGCRWGAHRTPLHVIYCHVAVIIIGTRHAQHSKHPRGQGWGLGATSEVAPPSVPPAPPPTAPRKPPCGL